MLVEILVPVVVLVVFALGLLHKFGRLEGRMDAELTAIKERLSDLRTEVREDVAAIREDIKDLLRQAPVSSVASESPAKLTDFGERLAAHMDAVQWAARLAVEFAPTMQDQEPYQVDQFAEAYVENSLSEEMKKTVARCAYEFGVGRVEPEAVLRVVLRDALLAAKPDA